MKRARIEFVVCYVATFWAFAALKLATSIDFKNGLGMYALLCSGTMALTLTHWRYERVRLAPTRGRDRVPRIISTSFITTLFIGLFPAWALFPLPLYFLLMFGLFNKGVYFDTKSTDAPPPSP